MKVYSNELVKVLCEKRTIKSVSCDNCNKILLPEKNKTYFELTFMRKSRSDSLEYKEHHLCSSYCLNRFVSDNSFDDTIGGIEYNKVNFTEEVENDNTIRIIKE